MNMKSFLIYFLSPFYGVKQGIKLSSCSATEHLKDGRKMESFSSFSCQGKKQRQNLNSLKAGTCFESKVQLSSVV